MSEGSANTPTIVDYIAIMLIAAGVVALGANDLYVKHGKNLSTDSSEVAGAQLLRELTEDRSSLLAQGVPAEDLSARDAEQRKARYPWELTDEQSAEHDENTDNAGYGAQGIFNRLGRVFGSGNKDTE